MLSSKKMVCPKKKKIQNQCNQNTFDVHTKIFNTPNIDNSVQQVVIQMMSH